MVLTFAGAAFAEPLSPGQTGQLPIAWDEGDFLDTEEECADDPVQPGTGELVWHFIHNGTDATSGTLTATFENAGETTTANGEPFESNNLHYWVTTDNPDTLLSASDDASGGLLVLSHICAGPEPTPSPTLPPTTTLETTPSSPAGNSLTLVFGLILAVAGGLVAYAMRPRRANR